MTKNVLAELDRRLATGPSAPRRAGAVLPFLRRQDAEGRIGGVSSTLSPVIARSEATKQSILSFPSMDGLLRGACHRARIRATRWLAMTLKNPIRPMQIAKFFPSALMASPFELPISSPTTTSTESGNGRIGNSSSARSCGRPASTPAPGAIPAPGPDANFNFAHIKTLIQKLEAGKFDAFFMADHLAVLNMPIDALKRSHTVDLVRAVHAAVGAGAGHRAHRPDRHRLDHVRRALSRRAPLRLARSHQRRPRRLEHRHHLESRTPR